METAFTDPSPAADLAAAGGTDESERRLADAFRRHRAYVGAIGLRMLGRDDEVDDLVQEVFLAAAGARGLSTLRDAEALRGWLATVAVRIARRKLRLRALRRALGMDGGERVDAAPLVEALPARDPGPEERALLARVHRILDTLPGKERLAWSLRQVEGERLETVAARCGCSLATAKRRIAAAQAAIDHAVADGPSRRRRRLARVATIALLFASLALGAAWARRELQRARVPGPGSRGNAPRGDLAPSRCGPRRWPCARPVESAGSVPACLGPLASLAHATTPGASTTPATTRRQRAPRTRGAPQMKTFQAILATGLLVPLLTDGGAALGADPPRTPVKAPGKSAVEIPVAAGTFAKAAVPAAADTARKPAGPGVRADDLRVGEKLREVTRDQINVLIHLLDNTATDDPERPDILYRLGGLYDEQRRYYNFAARELDQPIFEARSRGDTRAASRLQAKQADYQAREKSAQLDAARRYLDVAEHHHRYARMDEVLFNLAGLLTEAGRDDVARTYFKRLIKDYPQSIYIPDAYLSFGDHYFEKGDVRAALALYAKVTEFPSSRVAIYARYKMGWCHLNLKDWPQALAAFVTVVEQSRREAAADVRGRKGGRLTLEREARKDAVRAYAQVGEAGKAWPFFQRIGGDQAPELLELLGELYLQQGSYAPAVEVYHQLMAVSPSSPRLCAWQYEVVRATLARTGAVANADAAREVERLAATWEKLAAGGTGAKPDAIAECRDATAGTLRELATTWHREAQKTSEPRSYALAGRLYEKYLARFGDERDGYDMRFYLAELKFFEATRSNEARPYCDVAAAYGDVVRRDTSPRAKWLREAAYAQVLAWKSCLDIHDEREIEIGVARHNQRAAAPPSRAELALRTIPENQQRFIAALLDYVKYVPDGGDLPVILYRLGYIHYDYNHFQEATPWFEQVVRRFPATDQAIPAAMLVFDCHAALQHGVELRASVAEFCGKPELTVDPGFYKHCRVIQCSLGRDDAEHLERAGRHRDAGEAYFKLAERFPEYEKLDELYLNAETELERANRLGSAIRALQALLDKVPSSPLAKKAQFRLGRVYQQLAAYETAADHYERYAARFPDEKDAPSALLTAAFFRRGLGQTDKAIADTESFIKTYGPRAGMGDRAAGAAFVEAQVFEQREDWQRLEKHLAGYLKEWDGRGGVDRQVLAHVRLGEIAWRASCPVTPVQGACIEVRRPTTSERLAARMRKRAAAGKSCGVAIEVVLHERNPARVREAQAHFAEALRLWKGGAAAASIPEGSDKDDRAWRVADMAYFAAQARMAQGDAELEAFLRIALPEKLDFRRNTKQASERLVAWFGGKTRQMDKARRAYEDVILMKQAHFAIAAAGRIGQLFQVFAAQLTTAPVPSPSPIPRGVDVKAYVEDFRTAYCDQIMEKVDELEEKAVGALEVCLDKSTTLSWYNEWSSMCEAELNQLRPQRFPLAAEIRAQPGYLALQPPELVPLAHSLDRPSE